MTKLWGARFREGLDPSAREYSYSLWVDIRLAVYDLKVNLAHAGALKKAGIFSADDFSKVSTCLEALMAEFDDDEAELPGGDHDDEDIHSRIERLVTESLGDLGKRLHTGKSRNDQVITDVRLYVKDECLEVISLLRNLVTVFVDLAEANLGVPFPGFTHLQTAQPVLLSHHLLAYVEQFLRDVKRFEDVYLSSDVCPLGSAALAGNNYGLDREFIAKELGFSGLTSNSMDAVSDRDFMMEFMSAASICMTHFSRLSEELILWSSPLTGIVEIGDAFTTGSSIMPQKKNPDIAELARGKAGRVLGNMVALTHIIKGLPLAYNRDLQEDKNLLFDSVDTLVSTLEVFAKMMPTLRFNRAAIDTALANGYCLATELADYLVKKGIPFREAHEITGAVVLFAMEHKRGLENLTLEELTQFDVRIQDDVFLVLSVDAALAAKNVYGATSLSQVTEQIRRIRSLW
jgi:argininosuccinate lyase